MNMNTVAKLNQLLPGLTYQLVSQCGKIFFDKNLKISNLSGYLKATLRSFIEIESN